MIVYTSAVAFVAWLVGTASGLPQSVQGVHPYVGSYPLFSPASVGFYQRPRFSFSYGVHDALTGDSKSHAESREGDTVRGSYSLLEPDGTRRFVEYRADPATGFNAVVRREGPARALSRTHPINPSAPVEPAPVVEERPYPDDVPDPYFHQAPSAFPQPYTHHII